MPYATVAHLAGLVTNGWQDLAERACPTSPDVEPELMQAAATGASTAAWPADTVALALGGVAEVGTTEIRSLEMKFSDVSLTTGRSGSSPALVTNSA